MRSALPRRRLIPKWRPVAVTLATTEATSTEGKEAQQSLSENPEVLEKAIAQWRESKAPGLLGEVLSFSVHHNLLNKVIAIGREALRTGSAVTGVQAALIRDLDGLHEINALQLAVSQDLDSLTTRQRPRHPSQRLGV